MRGRLAGPQVGSRLMRRLPLHPGAVYGVVKEIKTAAEDLSPLVVAGAKGPARELVAALAERRRREARSATSPGRR